MKKDISKKYPNIADWIHNGSIEIGSGDYVQSDIFVRALDEGGEVFAKGNFKSLEKAMEALDEGIKKWCDENL